MKESRGQRLSIILSPSFLHISFVSLEEANHDVAEELPNTFEDSDEHRERQSEGEKEIFSTFVAQTEFIGEWFKSEENNDNSCNGELEEFFSGDNGEPHQKANGEDNVERREYQSQDQIKEKDLYLL